MIYVVSDALRADYGKLMHEMRNAPSGHMDTTFCRRDRENMDLWAFFTNMEAIFHIARNNGHEITMETLGEYEGTDIHNKFSAFETLASRSKNNQQCCWSHIILDAKELEEFYGKVGEKIKRAP